VSSHNSLIYDAELIQPPFRLIRSQTNNEPKYTADDGITAWGNANNEVVQNIQTTTFSSQTGLSDGTTINVRGSMVGGEQWVTIGDSAEWGSIFEEIQVENQVQGDPEYFYFTVGKVEDTAYFNFSLTLEWVDTS
jgi:hypothetical protein